MNVYPIFLNDLSGRRCVVIGCGHEVDQKVEALLACDACVILIGTALTDRLRALLTEGRIGWHDREYRSGDLKGAFLAIVTVIDPVATRPIWEEAERERVLLNAMDDVAHCTFVAGSVVRRGPVVISISSSGAAPALSVRIRQHLERTLGAGYGLMAGLLGSLRPAMRRRYPDFEERRRLWYELVDSDLRDLLERGRTDEALTLLSRIVTPEVAGQADFGVPSNPHQPKPAIQWN